MGSVGMVLSSPPGRHYVVRMAIKGDRPNEALMRELTCVGRDAEVILEHLRAPNSLPETFPVEQLLDICKALGDLPNGTARGCREPLEYARVRLPAIRREHIMFDEMAESLKDMGEPPLTRGMTLDRLLLNLKGSVLTALEEFRYQTSTETDDTVDPEPAIKTPNDPTVEAAVSRAQEVRDSLDLASEELTEIADPSSERADSLHRRIRDASGLATLARVELRMRTLVFRWYNNIVGRLADYPELIAAAGRGIKQAVDIAKPFQKRWEDFSSNLNGFLLEETRALGEMLVEVAELLRERRDDRRQQASTLPDQPDRFQLEAERRARELILAGRPVPAKVAALVENLDLSGSLAARARIPDLGFVRDLPNLKRLELLWAEFGGDLTPLGGLTGLTSFSLQVDRAVDLTPLGRLTGLTSLSLSANEACDLGPLATLQDLELLTLSGNPNFDLSPLSGLKKLRLIETTEFRSRIDRVSVDGLVKEP